MKGRVSLEFLILPPRQSSACAVPSARTVCGLIHEHEDSSLTPDPVCSAQGSCDAAASAAFMELPRCGASIRRAARVAASRSEFNAPQRDCS